MSSLTDLVLGDARDVSWDLVLPGPINCILTDPPFGVDYQSRRGKTADHDKIARPIEADESVDGAIGLFIDVMDQLQPYLADEVELYVFSRWDVQSDWIDALNSLDRMGFVHKMTLIWDKGALAMGDIDASWGPSYEPILYAKRGRRDLNRQRSSVLSFDRVPPSKRIHPTEKPVGLLEELLKASTDSGDVVVDPFAGSASTLQAAKNLGRLGFGAEKDTERHRLALRRLATELLF